MRILAVGAHPDDIELGCGATLARAVAGGAQVTMLVLTDGDLGPEGHRVRAAEALQAAQLLGADLRWGGYRDGTLVHGPDLVDRIGVELQRTGADLVFTHAPDDSHQDHAAAAMATVAAARLITDVLHYETPSTLRFEPTVFADVAGWTDAKVDALRCHLSQVMGAARVDLEAVEAQVRFRGFQGRMREAEAFAPSRTALRLPAPPAPPSALDVVPIAVEVGAPRRAALATAGHEPTQPAGAPRGATDVPRRRGAMAPVARSSVES